MPALEALMEQAVAAHEEHIRESIEMDYAWRLGKFDEWLERKYAKVLGDNNVNSGGNPGTNPGS